MSDIGIGLIGTGFMGACHAQAMAAVGALFEPALQPRLEIVADVDAAAASRAARRFRFAHATANWQDVIDNPAVGIVSVTSPNALHKPMAMAAIEAGKHVWCEKPLALTAADAQELAEAAEARGLTTLVGYNYLRSPAIAYAKSLVETGELGEVTYIRAVFDEDYMADPAVPFSWRCERVAAGSGTLGDMGSHVVSLARFFAGEITQVMADIKTVITERPAALANGEVDWNDMRPVENEDLAHAMIRFEGGAIGTIASNRLAWGRKNGLDFELYGTRGGLRFTQERFNEIEFFRPAAGKADNGYRTILTGADHPPYSRFTPAPGHGLGFNDLKIIEAAHLLEAIAGTTRPFPDFREGYRIELACDAMLRSVETGGWVTLDTKST